jgi:hypothetical protein
MGAAFLKSLGFTSTPPPSEALTHLIPYQTPRYPGDGNLAALGVAWGSPTLLAQQEGRGAAYVGIIFAGRPLDALRLLWHSVQYPRYPPGGVPRPGAGWALKTAQRPRPAARRRQKATSLGSKPFSSKRALWPITLVTSNEEGPSR